MGASPFMVFSFVSWGEKKGEDRGVLGSFCLCSAHCPGFPARCLLRAVPLEQEGGRHCYAAAQPHHLCTTLPTSSGGDCHLQTCLLQSGEVPICCGLFGQYGQKRYLGERWCRNRR